MQSASMTMNEQSFHLPPLGILSEMSDLQRSLLTSYGSYLRPAEGEQIIREGEPQEQLFLVLTGLLHVTINADGRIQHIASLGSGDSIGEMNIFDPISASATVLTKSACVVWTISRAQIEAFLENDPSAGNAFMKGLLKACSQRIRDINAKLANQSTIAKIHDYWKNS